jgi:hypothetical protein
MTKIHGYDGGDGEDQLIAALKAAVATEVADNWERVATKYMYIGSIVDICVAGGHVKKSRLGFAGYFYAKIGYAETTCRDCLKCWEKRHDFDRVRDWVSSNNGFKPKKASGPILYLDSHRAWSERLKPDATKRPKKLTAKEMRQMLQAYRSMLDRTGGAYVRLSEEVGSEPRVWHQITQERALLEQELGESESDADFPVTATRLTESDAQDGDDDNDVADHQQHSGTDTTSEDVADEKQHDIPAVDAANNDVPVPEQCPGTEKPSFTEVIGGIALARGQINRMLASASVPNRGQYSGTAFEIVGDIVKPKRRPRPPRKMRLTAPDTSDTRDDHAPLMVKDVRLTADRRAYLIEKYGLQKMRSGRANAADRQQAAQNRLCVYHLLESIGMMPDPKMAERLASMKFGFWMDEVDDMNAHQIIAAIRD